MIRIASPSTGVSAATAQCYRIEPSRYDETSSRDEREEAIRFRAVSFRRQKVNAVLRAITKAPLIRDKSVVRLSVTPSTK